ncbi:MAG: hypothetical protein N2442_07865 [Spirochaetes bacterium]|nr:hypothetical protein [Spirochaetota bacterium]
MNRGFCFLTCGVLLLFACITTPDSGNKAPKPTEPVQSTPSLPTLQEQKPPLAGPPQKQPELSNPAPAPPQKEEVKPSTKVEDENVKISQEEYKKTFQEVERVIDELNAIIKAGDYQRWEQYLTPKFIASVMDPEHLKKINEQPLLKRNRIEIKTLYDYFMYVVVPSRASVRLDDLIFSDQNRVKAFMFIRQDPVLIYQLEKIGETWKISVW